MKKQVSRIALGLILALAANGYSQEGRVQPCNTYAAMEEHFAADPQAKTRYEAGQKQLLEEREQFNNSSARPTAAFVYTIPVVFHILHQNGPENISDAQCIAALQQINSDYARQGSDVSTIAQPFQNLYISTDIKFMLAHKDPNGNCTSGIEHIYDARTNWNQANTSSNYNGITWNPTKYLNIIIVKSIIPSGTVTGGGIIVGYTYKPGTWGTGASQDAIVYNFGFLGGLNARSLSHEIGHWFNLDHTFGGTNNPGVSCGDDGISDTPPTKGNFSSCPSSLSGNTCAGATSVYAAGQQNTENFMDYSSCPKNFTTGQTNAMRSAAGSVVSNRQNVWQTANLVATDVNGTGLCAPIADYYSSTSIYTVCAGGSLNMKDFSYNGTVTSYQWAADAGAVISAATSSVTNITFPTVGTTNVTLTVSNSQGSSSKVRAVTVLNSTPGITGPTVEGFESNGVPSGWTVINPDATSTKWDQTYDAFAYEGAACFYLEGAQAGANQVDILESPIVDVASNSTLPFTFALAYAQKTSSQNDVLKVQATKDCGGSWTDVVTLNGASMQANSGGITTNSFTPFVTQEWKIITVSSYPYWNQFTSSSSVKFRFTFVEGSTGGGNNIYIDAINLFTAGDGINELTKSYRFGLQPNPASGEATVSFKLDDAATVKVNVTDMLGKEITVAVNGTLTPGVQNIAINSNSSLSQGVYFVNLTVNGAKMTRKLIIN